MNALHAVHRSLDDLRRKQAEEAEQVLRMNEEARVAARQPRPIGWTSWPPVSGGGASRALTTMRPPSASRWR